MSIKVSANLRCWSLTTQCCQISRVSRRYATVAEASSSSAGSIGNPFPYPKHRNPTPHQIFHLPRNASEADIKARYYDLVRLYHPDKPGVSVSPDVVHKQFQAITAAYDSLRGKTALDGGPGPGASGNTDTRYQTTAAYRAMRRRRQELYDSGPVDDSRKDTLIIIGVVATIAFVIVHTATTRREALAEAMARSRQLAVHNERTQRPRHEERLSSDNVPTSEKI